jgi:hypothetical protein
VHAEAYNYPEPFFAPRCWRVRQSPPDPRQLADAASALSQARASLIIAGGGVHYARAARPFRGALRLAGRTLLGAREAAVLFTDAHRQPGVSRYGGQRLSRIGLTRSGAKRTPNSNHIATGGLRSNHGRAFSSCAASRNSIASSPWRATN